MVSGSKARLMSQSSTACLKPVAVLLDANIWYLDPLLKGPECAALLYYLHDQKNFLALPEVVEREVEKNLNKRAEESAELIDKGWRFLERITGRRPDFRAPSKTERQIALNSRLEEIQALIVRVPLRIDHVRSALDRVNDGTPPNAS
jgi:hypothetical protein